MNTKNLTDLLQSLIEPDASIQSFEVRGISQNSRTVQRGDLFLACAGSQGSHGIAYGGEAGKKGAIAIAWEPTDELQNMPGQFVVEQTGKGKYTIPLLAVDKLHQKAGQIAARFYDEPTKQMQVIGITGTNGKTSISFFVAQCLSVKQPCGVLGTIGNGLFDLTFADIKTSSHTTADAVSLQAMMADFHSKGAKQVVMEVSSHALDQYRVAGVDFNLGVFTNLSRDHLDYHGDMESYARAKRKLFLDYELDVAIVNRDDDEGRKIISALKSARKKVLTYSIADSDIRNEKSADIFASNVHAKNDGTLFNFCIAEQQAQVKIALLGTFNISNVLATAGVLHALGQRFWDIVKYLQDLQSVPGRMELIKSDTGAKSAQFIVDYAHTPDALEQALKALQEHTDVAIGVKIWCVFGCGGDRDKGKRKLMGEIACRYADHIILTTDNPRGEEPREIIADIETGMDHMVEYQIEVDRTNAIRLAIESANDNDIVLVAGKGHENYQEVKGIKHFYSDQQIIREILAEIGK